MAYCQKHTQPWPPLDFHSAHTAATSILSHMVLLPEKVKAIWYNSRESVRGRELISIHSHIFKSLKFKSDWFPWTILNHIHSPSSTWTLCSPYFKGCCLRANVPQEPLGTRYRHHLSVIYSSRHALPFSLVGLSLLILQSPTQGDPLPSPSCLNCRWEPKFPFLNSPESKCTNMFFSFLLSNLLHTAFLTYPGTQHDNFKGTHISTHKFMSLLSSQDHSHTKCFISCATCQASPLWTSFSDSWWVTALQLAYHLWINWIFYLPQRMLLTLTVTNLLPNFISIYQWPSRWSKMQNSWLNSVSQKVMSPSLGMGHLVIGYLQM